MWKKFVIDYLTFSKRDRYAMYILLSLFVVLIIVPNLIPEKKHEIPDHAALIDQIKTAFPDSGTYKTDNRPGRFDADGIAGMASAPSPLFYFDPNSIGAEDWERLGVSKRTAATIQKYRAKGGRFKKPDDLLKIYTLDKAIATRLIPYVRIKEQHIPSPTPDPAPTSQSYYSPAPSSYPKKEYTIVDINAADTTALKSFPGIGSKLAIRIVAYRERLGGFVSPDQMAEVQFLHDSVYQKIRPFLVLNQTSVRKLNINSATLEELGPHPYMGYRLARSIISYRSQHGPFNSLSQLKSLHLISDEKYNQMAPYLTIE